jgi:hypothetical protein
MAKEKQLDLPDMPADTELGKAARALADKREDIAEAKLKLEELEVTLLKAMREAKKKRFKIQSGTQNFEVNLVESSEHVRIKKVTKQPRDHEQVVGE